jgi:predicted unusual protein kinase regulating ubiquinone biosynthesis (AarF/ABC1/UbiB family)
MLYFDAIKSIYIIIKTYVLYNVGLVEYTESVKNICNDLSKINILYTKIIQWASDLRSKSHEVNDLTNEKELNKFIRDFTNKVSYTNEDIDYESLNQLCDIAQNNGDNLKLDSFTPINSGTIALVFKASLNNKPIVVKILRNNIKNKLTDSINLFLFIFTILQYVPYVWNIDILSVFKMNMDTLLKQVDFITEMNNIDMYYNETNMIDALVIPKVYKYFTETNNKIIVMDFLKGKTVYELSEEEKIIFSKQMMNLWLQINLQTNLIHGDLHPGNVLFMDNKIGYIDFGIILIIDIEEQNVILNFLKNYAYNDYEQMFEDLFNETFIKNMIKIKDNNDCKLKNIKNKFMYLKNNNTIFANNNISKMDIYIIMSEAKKEGIIINEFTAFTLLSSVTVLGLNKCLNENYFLIFSDEIKKFMKKITFE